MAKKNRKWRNPFYAMLIPVGAVFCVTTFAYGYMAFQQVNAGRSTAVVNQQNHQLFEWLRSHGTTAILVELAILSILTVGAISTDSWWTREPEPTVKSTDGE